MTEHDKWRPIVAPYLVGNGIEIATGGDPIVKTSIQFELTERSYEHYNNGQPLRGPVHWRNDTAIFKLPFQTGVLDYVASSHLIEDFLLWDDLLIEWTRVLKQGGKLVICLPDKQRWNKAVANGQTPNMAHKHEGFVGELSLYAPKMGWNVIADRFTESPEGDYNILFVAEKI